MTPCQVKSKRLWPFRGIQKISMNKKDFAQFFDLFTFFTVLKSMSTKTSNESQHLVLNLIPCGSIFWQCCQKSPSSGEGFQKTSIEKNLQIEIQNNWEQWSILGAKIKTRVFSFNVMWMKVSGHRSIEKNWSKWTLWEKPFVQETPMRQKQSLKPSSSVTTFTWHWWCDDLDFLCEFDVTHQKSKCSHHFNRLTQNNSCDSMKFTLCVKSLPLKTNLIIVCKHTVIMKIEVSFFKKEMIFNGCFPNDSFSQHFVKDHEWIHCGPACCLFN